MASLFLKFGVVVRTMFIALLALSLSACSGLLFYPSKQLFSTPENWQLSYEDVWLPSEDGTLLHGWWLPAQARRDAQAQPTELISARGSVYFLHGNAENISTHIASVFWLPAAGYNVFLLDYRGYGRSEGSPEMAAVIDDVRAGYHWVQQKAGPMIVLGQSLGGGLGGFVAATEEHPPAALVLDAPVASYPRIAAEVARRNWLTWLFAPLASWLMPDEYDLDAVIGQLRAPLLVFRSDDDRVVPSTHADTIYALAINARSTLRIATTGRHIATFNSEVNRQHLLDFLASHVLARKAVPGSPEM